MANVDLKSLIGTLNPYCKRALEQAASLCMNRGHYEVCVEHLLWVMLDDGTGDLPRIFKAFDLDPGRVKTELMPALESLRSGNTGRPVFSPFLLRLFGRAWMIASVDMKATSVRSGILLMTILEGPARYASGDWLELIEDFSQETLKNRFYDMVLDSAETSRSARTSAQPQGGGGGGGGAAHQGAPADETALGRYAMNFTERARAGEIDPIFGRDREIRQMIDILARRRKNNPIIVGEAGVGKTALAEGLALRIVEKDVPDVLRGVELIALDLGLLQAGAGVKGEFEARLKQVIDEVRGSPVPIILFIDEAHTMIGAGGAEGGSDAANLLKPALARGELKTIAATTWTEYKKFFEKDAALSRRFQLVKVEEPSVADTITMLRGLRTRYEESHGVILRDDALVAAAELAARYITGRYHPDKGIDLVDTASARVRVALTARPAELEDAERAQAALEREKAVLLRDAEQCAVDPTERLGELEEEIAALGETIESLTEEWQREREAADAVIAARLAFNKANGTLKADEEEPAKAEADAEGEEAAEVAESEPPLSLEDARANLRAALAHLKEAQGKDPLVNVEVTPEVIGRVVSDWTGIPLGKMVRDQATALLKLEDDLQSRIKGQDHAMQVIAERVRASKAGLGNPKAPMGVFLFVGPSGVGKTETALGVADLLFGGEKFMTTINMSEFQEKHTVSRLIGSPPGYVGYGEGGVLTEAVRQRPYSVVLLDEVEKAHPEVLNLFYQVFDKGMLADGEGRVIDFKDTIIFLTSNLASDITMKMCQDGKVRPNIDDVATEIRPVLNGHFKPALLARMSVVPYYPISREVMREIVVLKLGRLQKQLAEAHKMTLTITDRVLDLITSRCTVAETGARNIDYIINGSLLPRISTEVLSQLADGTLPDTLTIDVQEKEFTFTFSDGPITVPPYAGPPAEPVTPVEQAQGAPVPAMFEEIAEKMADKIAAEQGIGDAAQAAADDVAPAEAPKKISPPDDGLTPAERAQRLAAQAQAMLAQVSGGKRPAADEPPADEA